ncbi:DUF354 domain-containing protein [Natrialbaceae archaeon A-CW2]
MRVLFDLYHPAHVHLYKNAIREMEREGHETLIASRKKDLTVELLDAYGFNHEILSTKKSGGIGTFSEVTKRFIKLYLIANEFEPDVITGRPNPVTSAIGRLTGATTILLKDSDYRTIHSKLTYRMADLLYIPENLEIDVGAMEHRVNGFQELAYLHPKWFEPNPRLLKEYGISPFDDYVVVRFIGKDAYHDDSQKGFSRSGRQQLISTLSEHGDVYITSEKPLEPEFTPFQLPIPPHLIHHLLSFANLFVGDSGTMATEAAILGTPAVRVRTNSFTVEKELSNFRILEEEYGLLHSFENQFAAIDQVNTLLQQSNLASDWGLRRDKMLADKVDVTEDMVSLFLNEGQK